MLPVTWYAIGLILPVYTLCKIKEYYMLIYWKFVKIRLFILLIFQIIAF
jgi:hypothetical protein